MTNELFETTLIDPETGFALRAASLPRSQLPDWTSDPFTLMRSLRFRPTLVFEIPRQNLTDGLRAILLNEDTESAAAWLESPPNPIHLEQAHLDEWGQAFENAVGTQVDALLVQESRDAKRRGTKLQRQRPRVEKGSSADRASHDFTSRVASDAVVPFRNSPADFYTISDFTEQARVWLVTVGKNPLLLVWGVGGYLLWSATVGAGAGIRRGLSGGLRYRILKLFGVPDEYIRTELMSDKGNGEEADRDEDE